MGIAQIAQAMPSDMQYHLTHFESYADFAKSADTFDIIFLDYFLDIDRITSDKILPEVKQRATKVVAFSSAKSANKHLRELGADAAITKQWSGKNDALEDYILEITTS